MATYQEALNLIGSIDTAIAGNDMAQFKVYAQDEGLAPRRLKPAEFFALLANDSLNNGPLFRALQGEAPPNSPAFARAALYTDYVAYLSARAEMLSQAPVNFNAPVTSLIDDPGWVVPFLRITDVVAGIRGNPEALNLTKPIQQAAEALASTVEDRARSEPPPPPLDPVLNRGTEMGDPPRGEGNGPPRPVE